MSLMIVSRPAEYRVLLVIFSHDLAIAVDCCGAEIGAAHIDAYRVSACGRMIANCIEFAVSKRLTSERINSLVLCGRTPCAAMATFRRFLKPVAFRLHFGLNFFQAHLVLRANGNAQVFLAVFQQHQLTVRLKGCMQLLKHSLWPG